MIGRILINIYFTKGNRSKKKSFSRLRLTTAICQGINKSYFRRFISIDNKQVKVKQKDPRLPFFLTYRHPPM